jgi:tripartite-type tricarboxylate transporter receptor subunit TctC
MKRTVGLVLSMLGLAYLVAGSAASAWAQTYPTRPIRFILPFPPGGNTDILGRIAGQKLSERLGQPVVADNRAGLGGYLGLDLTSKAAPDGYTITIASMVYASGPLTYPDLKFNPEKGLASIGQLSEAPNLVVVHPAVPAKSLKEFVDYARANPKKLNYATSGTGSTLHLATAMLSRVAKMDVVHVP